MAWIKRNLFFLIGTLIAVALMVVGIFYLLGQINDENQVTTDIQARYAELTRLAGQKPHPGNDKIDNIKTAKEQESALRDYVKKERGYFKHIDSIPDSSNGKIGNADFARALGNTVAELRRSAQQQSVDLPLDFYFTFKSQNNAFIFEPGSLELLASHLGEIKALCDVLFTAKITIDNIQREIVSTNQDTNPSDYLQTRKTVSTPLADLTPYQVTFHCFSAELAQVLTSLATSPYGFMVESINVEPLGGSSDNGGPGTPFSPTGVPPSPPGINNRRPGFIPPPANVPAAPAAGHGPTDFIKDKAFRVVLMIDVVKPKPEAKVK